MSKENPVKIGIIGGTGFEDPAVFKKGKPRVVSTPYGKPSSSIYQGRLDTVDILFLSRHDKKHSLTPSEVPNQANIWALKKLGCSHILATSACGSLRLNIKPGDLVFVDQFIDHTRFRPQTFSRKNKIIHVSMAEPFCPNLRKTLIWGAKKLNYRFHPSGTIVTIEGPRFSSLAESLMFRTLGGDVINMSTVPEAILARELGLHYAVIATSTDYDCWHKSKENVTAAMVRDVMTANVEKVTKLILDCLPKIVQYCNCPCQQEIGEII